MVEYTVFSAGVLRPEEDFTDGNGQKEIESLLRDVVLELAGLTTVQRAGSCRQAGLDA